MVLSNIPERKGTFPKEKVKTTTAMKFRSASDAALLGKHRSRHQRSLKQSTSSKYIGLLDDDDDDHNVRVIRDSRTMHYVMPDINPTMLEREKVKVKPPCPLPPVPFI